MYTMLVGAEKGVGGCAPNRQGRDWKGESNASAYARALVDLLQLLYNLYNLHGFGFHYYGFGDVVPTFQKLQCIYELFKCITLPTSPLRLLGRLGK